jgi:CarD family transcriptional regulator
LSVDEAEKVVDILKDKNVKIDTQTWNRRHRDYKEKINTGSVFEIAEVLRDLYVLKTDKELSFGEKSMLDAAKNLLLKEINLRPEVRELVSADIEMKAIFDLQ